MLLHLHNGRPEFGHRAQRSAGFFRFLQRALTDTLQLRVGTPLTHRPEKEPHHKHPHEHTDEHTPSQHSLFHTAALLSIAKPVLPRTHLRDPCPGSGAERLPDHSCTPATALAACPP